MNWLEHHYSSSPGRARNTRGRDVSRRLGRLAVSCVFLGIGACGGGGGGGGSSTSVVNPSADSGLNQRPSNLSCVVPPRDTGNVSLATPRAFPNLRFTQPVAMLQAPGDDTRWFVLEQNGIIRTFLNDPAVAASSVFLDIRDRVWTLDQSEAGLLGLAFHPDFANNGRAYINYSNFENGQLRSVTAEFTSPDGGMTLDPNSERRLLTVLKREDNHNGGQLAFGPSEPGRFLYVGLGDGGGGGDPEENAQNPARLLGKMLRIDVDTQPGGQPYGIPADNPFSGNPRCNANGTGSQACPEIYALGLRNPWRWSFDRQTNTLWAGDVGQGTYEEIDIIELGRNYGWDNREGAHCFEPPSGCQTAGMTDPVAEYDHTVGSAITGGYVYRGTQPTALWGQYIFGDFESGMIASLAPASGEGYEINRLVEPGAVPPGASGQLWPSSFGEANDGELYLLDYFSGEIRQLLFTGGGGGGDNVPDLLSDTGCINTTSPAAPPLESLIPYAPNASFWSDGAVKDRWIGLPNGLNISVTGSGDWDLPNGSVLLKHFRLGGRIIETRLFMRHPDGVWAGYTYEWNATQTDATRVRGGRVITIGGQDWIFPSEAQCAQCHTEAAGFSLGLETAQLNGTLTYPQTGRSANQITTLNEINVLSPRVGPDPPAYADPSDTSASLDDRARSYLHTNCANCHRPQGPTTVPLDLRHDTALIQTGTCDVMPTRGDIGIVDARIIAPGDPDRSVLLARMATRNADMMPPLASNLPDTAGIALISDWINSLPPNACQ